MTASSDISKLCQLMSLKAKGQWRLKLEEFPSVFSMFIRFQQHEVDTLWYLILNVQKSFLYFLFIFFSPRLLVDTWHSVRTLISCCCFCWSNFHKTRWHFSETVMAHNRIPFKLQRKILQTRYLLFLEQSILRYWFFRLIGKIIFI